MWVRSAFWTGVPRTGRTDALRVALECSYAPGLRALPGVIDVELLWPQRADEDAVPVFCQALLKFPSREVMNQAMASPEVNVLRARMGDILSLFDGKITHIDFEIGEKPSTASESCHMTRRTPCQSEQQRAFMMVTMKITDESWIEPYFEEVPRILAEYGAISIAGARDVRLIEGTGTTPDRAAILTFPSLDAIDRFMADARYQAFREMREHGAISQIAVFENAVSGGELV